MANALHQNLKEGDMVMVKGHVEPFVCMDGFGMTSFTAGCAIYGTWALSGKEDRIQGYEIDAEATELLKAEMERLLNRA